VDNLGWKLAAVLNGDAPITLIETYNEERTHGSAENILNSSRATNFMTPKSPIEALFRDEVLNLATTHPFARKLINSGRLSRPCSLAGMALQTDGDAPVRPGDAVIDAPLRGPFGDTWLIVEIPPSFTLLGFGNVTLPAIDGIARIGINSHADYPCFEDVEGHASRRFGTDTIYLIRPDGHICAVFDTPDAAAITTAYHTAKGSK
jgi:3-(3-hydroxy-phenyl)propionate hydroxylase